METHCIVSAYQDIADTAGVTNKEQNLTNAPVEDACGSWNICAVRNGATVLVLGQIGDWFYVSLQNSQNGSDLVSGFHRTKTPLLDFVPSLKGPGQETARGAETLTDYIRKADVTYITLSSYALTGAKGDTAGLSAALHNAPSGARPQWSTTDSGVAFFSADLLTATSRVSGQNGVTSVEVSRNIILKAEGTAEIRVSYGKAYARCFVSSYAQVNIQAFTNTGNEYYRL